MNKFFRIAAIALVVMSSVVFATGCESSADKVSENLSTAAENFEVQRRIVGVNGITDKVEFVVEGRCSVEGDNLGDLQALTVICKQGPNNYKKHWLGVPDNLIFIVTQIQGLPASEYRTRIILKPENLVPDFDLQTGTQP